VIISFKKGYSEDRLSIRVQSVLFNRAICTALCCQLIAIIVQIWSWSTCSWYLLLWCSTYSFLLLRNPFLLNISPVMGLIC